MDTMIHKHLVKQEYAQFIIETEHLILNITENLIGDHNVENDERNRRIEKKPSLIYCDHYIKVSNYDKFNIKKQYEREDMMKYGK